MRLSPIVLFVLAFQIAGDDASGLPAYTLLVGRGLVVVLHQRAQALDLLFGSTAEPKLWRRLAGMKYALHTGGP